MEQFQEGGKMAEMKGQKYGEIHGILKKTHQITVQIFH